MFIFIVFDWNDLDRFGFSRFFDGFCINADPAPALSVSSSSE